MVSRMTSDKCLFLDFDGVLFDTVREAYAVAVIASGKYETIADIDFSGRHYLRFKALRYLVAPASDYYFILKLLEFSLEKSLIECQRIFFDMKSQAQYLSCAEQFQECFFSTRKSIMTSDYKKWLALNYPYEFFYEIKNIIECSQKSIKIVTTKNKDAIIALLRSEKVEIIPEIYDAEAFKKFGSKKNIIHFICTEQGIVSGIFIDDSLHHLEQCRSLDGIALFQPSWGYLAPTDRGIFCKPLIKTITEYLGVRLNAREHKGECMYKFEGKLYSQLCTLRDKFALLGMYAEFDREGASFRDLVRLRRLTDRAGTPLILKISGIAAVRDLRDSIEIGVDGLCVPFVDSPYHLSVFLDSYAKVYKEHKIEIWIELATPHALKELDNLLEFSQGVVDGILLNMHHLFLASTETNLDESVLIAIERIASFNIKPVLVDDDIRNWSPTLSDNLQQTQALILINKVVIPASILSDSVFKEALQLEEFSILSKKDFCDLAVEQDINKLTSLQMEL